MFKLTLNVDKQGRKRSHRFAPRGKRLLERERERERRESEGERERKRKIL